MSWGTKSWLWISRPSAAFVSTSAGSTCASIGKPLRAVGNTILCAPAGCDGADASFHTPSDCGIFQSALIVASALPDASGDGIVSIPAPVVTCHGMPPATGTAQMWRRSMSFAFVQ